MEKRVLAGLEPREVLYWFEEICRIPHGTFHEKQISDYLKRFAEERGYAVRQDETWNLAIEVPGEGCSNEWLEAVTDEVYAKLN